jgi:hypothetical protein
MNHSIRSADDVPGAITQDLMGRLENLDSADK